MIEWLVSVSEPLLDAIQDRPRWVDDALIVCAGLGGVLTHCLGAQRICRVDGRVRRTTAQALKHARWQRPLLPAAVATLAILLTLHACDSLRASDGKAMRPEWAVMLLVFIALIGWSGFATVAALIGKPVAPWTKKTDSDEFVVWKQQAFVQYAKKVPYPGTPAARQTGNR